MSRVIRLMRHLCESCRTRPTTELVRLGAARFRVRADCYPTTSEAEAS